MDFVQKTIAPKGRRKYGEYITSNSTIKNVISKSYSTGSGGQNTNTGTTESIPQYYLGLSRNSHTFDGLSVSVSAQTDTVEVVSILNSEKWIACVGNLATSAESATYDISGITSGLNVSVSANCTSAASISISVDSGITTSEGVLKIPLNIYLKRDNYLTSKSDFYDKKSYCASQIIEYQWNIPASSDSDFRLDLSNENCGINCDKDYNILAGSIRPNCKATLYYGNSIVQTGVTYYITYPASQHVQGVSINSSDGTITFNAGTASTPFNFDGTPLAITVSARYNGVLMPSKTMTISKSAAGQNGQNGQDGRDGVDGADGEDAQTNWIELSTTAIVVDKETSGYTPSSVIATAYTQIGENQPFINTGLTIYYGYETNNPSNIYSGPISNIQIQYSTLNFCLKNNLGNPYELESVPILKNGQDGKDGQDGRDGQDGEKGDTGLKGPSLRGPVDWYSQTTSRRFCNGAYDAQHPDDANWIDIINKDNVYYYCNTSYDGSSMDSWSSVQSKWTASDKQFNFIATNLLLASAATINFLGSNQILVKDSDLSGGTVVAGVVGGQGVNFFAGAPTPNSAPFKVNYDGSIIATKGKLSTIETNKLTNPFVFSNQGIADSGLSINYDNLYNNEIGTGGGAVSISASYEHLDWTINSVGRRLTLCGSFYLEAPNGKYFYDNGATLSKLICFSEKIELLGIGDSSNFWGYVVVNRDNYRTAVPFGRRPNIQAQGSVIYNNGVFYFHGYIAPPLAQYFVRQDTTTSSNIDLVSSTVGTLRLVIPRAYANSVDDIYVNVSPYGKSTNSLPLNCYVDKITTGTYYSHSVYFIDIITYDKNSNAVRGGIFFEIRNLRDFEMPPASWYKYYINMQSTKSIGNTASTGTIPIDSNYSAWTATSNQSWLTVSKTNATTLSYSATANGGSSSRDAIITVSIPNVTKTCTVTQSSTPSSEYVFLAPNSMTIDATASTFTVDVTSTYGSTNVPLTTSNVSITQSSAQMRTTVDSVSLVNGKYRFTFSCFESMSSISRTATLTFTQPNSGLICTTVVTQNGY